MHTQHTTRRAAKCHTGVRDEVVDWEAPNDQDAVGDAVYVCVAECERGTEAVGVVDIDTDGTAVSDEVTDATLDGETVSDTDATDVGEADGVRVADTDVAADLVTVGATDAEGDDVAGAV